MADHPAGDVPEGAREQLLRGLVVPEAVALALTKGAIGFMQIVRSLDNLKSELLLSSLELPAHQLRSLSMAVDLMLAIGTREVEYDAADRCFRPTANGSGAGPGDTSYDSELQNDVVDWLRRQMAAGNAAKADEAREKED